MGLSSILSIRLIGDGMTKSEMLERLKSIESDMKRLSNEIADLQDELDDIGYQYEELLEEYLNL